MADVLLYFANLNYTKKSNNKTNSTNFIMMIIDLIAEFYKNQVFKLFVKNNVAQVLTNILSSEWISEAETVSAARGFPQLVVM